MLYHQTRSRRLQPQLLRVGLGDRVAGMRGDIQASNNVLQSSKVGVKLEGRQHAPAIAAASLTADDPVNWNKDFLALIGTVLISTGWQSRPAPRLLQG